VVKAVIGSREVPKERRVAHAVWAALAILVSLLLIFGGQGHPHPVIFLPLVIVVWIVGHFTIWGVSWLAVKGRRRASGIEAGERSWPMGLRFALMGTGIAASVGLLQIVVTAFRGKMYPYHDVTLWGIMMAIWLVHGACFVGLLLRRPWSRLVSVMLAFGWALLAAHQITEHLMRGYRLDIVGLLIVSAGMVVLFLFGLHLATSNKVKAFLSD
jgi:hypothetical protein